MTGCAELPVTFFSFSSFFFLFSLYFGRFWWHSLDSPVLFRSIDPWCHSLSPENRSTLLQYKCTATCILPADEDTTLHISSVTVFLVFSLSLYQTVCSFYLTCFTYITFIVKENNCHLIFELAICFWFISHDCSTCQLNNCLVSKLPLIKRSNKKPPSNNIHPKEYISASFLW